MGLFLRARFYHIFLTEEGLTGVWSMLDWYVGFGVGSVISTKIYYEIIKIVYNDY